MNLLIGNPRICKFYNTQKGCYDGDNCLFMHLDPETHFYYRHKRSKNPDCMRAQCKYDILKEKCHHGNRCTFIHKSDDVRFNKRKRYRETSDDYETQRESKYHIVSHKDCKSQLSSLRDEYEALEAKRDRLYTECESLEIKYANLNDKYLLSKELHTYLVEKCDELENKKTSIEDDIVRKEIDMVR